MADNRDRDIRRRQDQTRETMENFKDAVFKRGKIILPAVLIAALLITAGIGIFTHKKKEEQEDVQTNAGAEAETIEVQSGEIPVPEVPLEENAHPEINELIAKYYHAMETGETDNLSEIVSPLTDSYRIRFTELAKYVEAAPSVTVYTKPGPIEDSFIAYVRTEIQLAASNGQTVPGMETYYICKNDAGNYYINIEKEVDQEIADYIATVSLQDDVKDLNNEVTVAFNNLIIENKEAAQNYVDVKQSLTKGVQESLASMQEAETEEQEPEEAEEPAETAVTTRKTVKTTDVVNMRSSDSEKSDKLGKLEIGTELTALEERANGWTKVTDGTQEFFLKSDYLETVSEEPVAEETAEEEPETEPEEEGETPQSVNTSLGSNGYVTAKTTVNVRKSASETGERLGVVYQGERLELIMNQADGWCKVKYDGQTAYVKSEFME